MTLKIDQQSIHQLEFDVIYNQVLSHLHTQKASQRYKIPTFLTESDQIIEESGRVLECVNYINQVHSLSRSFWTDLSLVDPSWKVSNKIIPIEDQIVIWNVAAMHAYLYKAFVNQESPYPLISDMMASQLPLTDVIDRMETTLSSDGEVLDSASPELKKIRTGIERLVHSIGKKAEELSRTFSDQGFLTANQPTIKNGRLVFPVAVEHKRKIQGFIHDVSATGHTVYIEPNELIEINHRIIEKRSEEQREIKKILLLNSELIRTCIGELEDAEQFLIVFDLIHAKAIFLSAFDHLDIPSVSSGNWWQLTNAVHPLLFLNHREKKLETIPLNLEFGAPDHQLMVISGPNAGGKSVSIKTVGLLQLMFQNGMPLPASHPSSLPILYFIGTSIGDQQSITDDLSSFSAHIKEIRHIFEGLIPGKSLVIIDEICAGTDPEEGEALGIEILKAFIRQQASGFITTHYNGIKLFLESEPAGLNASMLFNTQTLTPTYQLQMGIPGKSYAIELAERMQLSGTIIEHSKTRLSAGHLSYTELQNRLEWVLNENKKLKEQYEQAVKIQDQINQSLEREKEAFEKKEKTIKKELRNQYKNEFETLQRKIFSELESIKKAGNTKITEERNRLIEVVQVAAKPLITDPERQSEAVKSKVGDWVRIEGTGKAGQIKSIKGSRADVQFDNLKMSLDLANLEPAKAEHQLSSTQIEADDFTREAATEINLIGLTINEAMDKLGYYLEKAVYHQLPAVRIIHGKGSGTLRKAVHDFLKTQSEVDSYTLANWNEGSTGVTVVNLK